MADKNKKADETPATNTQESQPPTPPVSGSVEEALNARLTALENRTKRTEEALTQPREDATVTARLAALEKVIVDREEEVEDLNVTVAKLSKATDPERSKELPAPFTLGKGKAAKTYRFAYRAIKFAGRKITAQEIADDHELATELIEKGCSILVEV